MWRPLLAPYQTMHSRPLQILQLDTTAFQRVEIVPIHDTQADPLPKHLSTKVSTQIAYFFGASTNVGKHSFSVLLCLFVACSVNLRSSIVSEHSHPHQLLIYPSCARLLSSIPTLSSQNTILRLSCLTLSFITNATSTTRVWWLTQVP